MRVVRCASYDDPAAVAAREDAEWFMDYRNSDGSVSEMCGNGVRVFARYLIEHEGATSPVRIGTRAGVKTLTLQDDGRLTVDMGEPVVVGETKVGVGQQHEVVLGAVALEEAEAHPSSLGSGLLSPRGTPKLSEGSATVEGMEINAETLMLSSTVGRCPDCGDNCLLVAVADLEYCCTTSAGAVSLRAQAAAAALVDRRAS
jgi:hypothetical protein